MGGGDSQIHLRRQLLRWIYQQRWIYPTQREREHRQTDSQTHCFINVDRLKKILYRYFVQFELLLLTSHVLSNLFQIMKKY